jgi:plastocyanin
MARRIGGDDTGRAAGRGAASRGRLRAALGLAAVALLASANGGPRRAAAAPAVAEVRIEEFRFTPATLEIQPGTTVRWVNRDEEFHTVAFADGQAASPALDTDASFSRRFDTPGTYTYRCAIHPHMAGTIAVR